MKTTQEHFRELDTQAGTQAAFEFRELRPAPIPVRHRNHLTPPERIGCLTIKHPLAESTINRSAPVELTPKDLAQGRARNAAKLRARAAARKGKPA